MKVPEYSWIFRYTYSFSYSSGGFCHVEVSYEANPIPLCLCMICQRMWEKHVALIQENERDCILLHSLYFDGNNFQLPLTKEN